jgi:hypothetical protein
MSAASVMISNTVTARHRVIYRRVSYVLEFREHRTDIGWTAGCCGGEKVVR